MFKAMINLSDLKAADDDHHALDQIVRASGTDWTLARPVALSNLRTPRQCTDWSRSSSGPVHSGWDVAVVGGP